VAGVHEAAYDSERFENDPSNSSPETVASDPSIQQPPAKKQKVEVQVAA